MAERIEESILGALITNETYTRKVIPFLQGDYFRDKHEKAILDETTKFFEKYNKLITPEILKIQLSNRADLSDSGLETAKNIVDVIVTTKTNDDWLVENTEKFCKDQSVYNAVLASIRIIDGEDAKLTADAIPDLLSKALSVSFDTQVGHEFIDNAADRWEFYNSKEERLPFRLKMMNKITQGGMPKKSLFCIAGSTGSGKSIFMTDTAAGTLAQGKNVLYITLEMAEEKIAERIDANLMKLDIHRLASIDKEEFMSKIDRIKARTQGRLFIKEFPTSSAHVGHFRALLQELKTKQNFKPDLIIVDYLGICASSRMKMGGSVNSYSYVKAIAEELRGLAAEFDVPVLTGAQLNRGGFGSSDVEMSDTAESAGLIHVLDFFFALIRTEELDAQGTVMIKQLKNRYGDTGMDKRFLLGLDRPKMTFYDVDDSAQKGIQQDAVAPVIPSRAGGFNSSGFKFNSSI